VARSLVVSDLHLGALSGRDVLRGPAARRRLLEALDGVDRLVLLGDVVELLEGRPRRALREAEPVLRAVGDALGRGREVLLVPGNHDHRLVRPHLRRLEAAGKPLRPSGRVPLSSSATLAALASWLRPARVEVRYPGAYLGPGVWAHHGHYVDRELLTLRAPPLPDRARPADYELRSGPNDLAPGIELPAVVAAPLEAYASVVRGAALAALPLVARTVGDRLAPLGAGALGWLFRERGLGAMAAVARRLRVRAAHVVFGHLHHGGPYDEVWTAGEGRPVALHNTGSWVHEPLLLAGVTPPHPYWPGGAVVVDEGAAPRAVRLLDGLEARDLR